MHTRSMMLLVVSLAAACGGGGYDGPTTPSTPGTTGTPSTTNAISVRDNSFSPTATTVPVGTTVTWTWGGSNAHNVTFVDNVASNTQTTGTFQRTFGTAGTFNYQCTVHTGMSGTITVR